MAAFFPTGTHYYISGAPEAAKAVAAVSNANPGVAAATANGFANGDIVILSAASLELDGRPARVASAATDAFALEGFNTTSTALYGPGFGVGKASRVATTSAGFTEITQWTDVSTEGGGQNYYEWVYPTDGKQRRRKTFKGARTIKLTMDWDPDLPWHSLLIAADKDGSTRVLMAVLPNQDKLLWSVEVSFTGEPLIANNRNNQVVAEFPLVAQDSTFYPAVA